MQHIARRYNAKQRRTCQTFNRAERRECRTRHRITVHDKTRQNKSSRPLRGVKRRTARHSTLQNRTETFCDSPRARRKYIALHNRTEQNNTAHRNTPCYQGKGRCRTEETKTKHHMTSYALFSANRHKHIPKQTIAPLPFGRAELEMLPRSTMTAECRTRRDSTRHIKFRRAKRYESAIRQRKSSHRTAKQGGAYQNTAEPTFRQSGACSSWSGHYRTTRDRTLQSNTIYKLRCAGWHRTAQNITKRHITKQLSRRAEI